MRALRQVDRRFGVWERPFRPCGAPPLTKSGEARNAHRSLLSITPQAKPRFCAAVLNLSLATSAGECARGYFVGDILAQRANVCVMQTAAVRLLRTHELSDFAFAAQNR